MRRRSSGSAAEDDGDDSTTTNPDRDTIVDEHAREGKVEPKKSSQPHNHPRKGLSLELDRRKSSDKRPSTARSRRPSNNNTNWHNTTTDVSLEKNRQPLREALINFSPGKSEIADNMAEPRTRRTRFRSPWSCSLLAVLVTAISTVFLVTIVHSFANRQLDNKGCRMSWMSPAFAKLSDFDTEHTRFASKYSTYLYREQGVDEDIKV